MKIFVESEIRIKSKAELILSALIEAEQLREWWGVSEAFVEKRDGGLYTLTWGKSADGIKYVSTGRINLYNRRSHLYLEDVLYLNSEKSILGPFHIYYDVKEKESYSVLKVKQTGFQKGEEHEWYLQAVQDGWPQALVMLKQYLEKD